MKMGTVRILQFFIVFSLIVTIKTDDICDPDNGAPSNGEYCILIPNYDTYQRAECGRPPFTTTSNKIETCVDECRNYCWLSCMVKEFDQHNGTVDPACACQGDRDQVCRNATGSVTYYTECANTTVPCPSPSYVDFAVFYFTWLSENINDMIFNYNFGNGTTFQTRCVDNPIKRALRLCVESNIDNLVTAGNDCSYLDGQFASIFNQCSQDHCSIGYMTGVNEYEQSDIHANIWPGVQNITARRCPFPTL